MILPFYQIFPATGSPTFFRPRICSGWKKHTFRIDTPVKPVQWKPGDFIEFAESLPDGRRIPFDLPNFRLADCWHIKEDESGRKLHFPLCCAVEPFMMTFKDLSIENDPGKDPLPALKVEFSIGDLSVNDEDFLEVIAHADGFEGPFDFMNFFNQYRIEKNTNVILGKIIHWTRNVYAVDTASVF